MYGWLLVYITMQELESEWEKELNQDKEIIYYNNIENKIYSQHPKL